MKAEQIVFISVLVGAVAVAALWKGLPKRAGTEITPEMLTIGMNRPIIWLFYNDSDVNSRNWSDFMARSSRVINIPLLNKCYETITKNNGDKYRIEVVGGLQGVAERLGGWASLPFLLRNPKGRVGLAEEDWIRSALLAKFGGLWLSPSVVCLKGFGVLPSDKVIAFGQDDEPLYGSDVPGFRALWSPSPNNPIMVEWEQRIRARLDNQLGGRQFRGDCKSDWAEFVANGAACELRIKEELGRDARTNKSLDLENILATGTGGRLPFQIPATAVYIPIPYNDLLNRRNFGWILRSSEEQIMESDIAIRYILDGTYVKST
jgi:hypothetical protein